MLRDRTGSEASVVFRVAVKVCDNEDRPACKHCGVSGVSGTENGMDDATRSVLDPDGASREYRFTDDEFSSTRCFPSDSDDDRVTVL